MRSNVNGTEKYVTIGRNSRGVTDRPIWMEMRQTRNTKEDDGDEDDCD